MSRLLLLEALQSEAAEQRQSRLPRLAAADIEWLAACETFWTRSVH